MIFSCCDTRRLNLVREHPTLNGIDHLEVVPWDAPPGLGGQRTLLVHLVKPIEDVPAREQVIIEGGDRQPNIEIEWLARADSVPPEAGLGASAQAYLDELFNLDRILVVRTAQTGGFLQLHAPPDCRPGFDPAD